MWILNKGSPSLIYNWKPCGFRVRVSAVLRFQLFRVFFLIFLLILYFFFLFGYFCFFGGILDIFRGTEGFMAFWRHFKPFGGFLHGFMDF